MEVESGEQKFGLNIMKLSEEMRTFLNHGSKVLSINNLKDYLKENNERCFIP